MAATTKKTTSAIAHLMKFDPELITFLREGDLAEAKLLKKMPRAVYFDLGKFGTGVVYGSELINARSITKGLSVGDAVSAKVVALENDEGYIELSLAGAHQQKNWQGLKELKDNGETLTVKIIGANSGGLVADVHEIKAFLPVSQLSNDHYPRVTDGDRGKILEELKKLVNQELTVKILDVNPRLDKLIISEREVQEHNIKQLIAKYKVGDTIEGIISGVADFGAFVRFADNPSIEGLIHISELDHRLIDSPKEIVKVDDMVKVTIIDIKESQVSLSLKALRPNPWDHAKEFFKEGQEVQGTVYKYNPFGAYINLEHDLQGLLHVSEFGSLEEMKAALPPASTHSFVLESLKPEEKRILLKFKRA